MQALSEHMQTADRRLIDKELSVCMLGSDGYAQKAGADDKQQAPISHTDSL